MEGDGPRSGRSGAERETGSWNFHDHEPMRPVDIPLAGPLVDQERTGIVLHDLDGGAVAEAAYPGAVCKRDRNGARDLRGRSRIAPLFRRQRARSYAAPIGNARGRPAASERLRTDEAEREVAMAPAAHSAT